MAIKYFRVNGVDYNLSVLEEAQQHIDDAMNAAESAHSAAASANSAAGLAAEKIAELSNYSSELATMKASLEKLEELYGNNVEGYVRLSGVSDPILSFRHYKNDVGNESVFDAIRPCLVEAGTGKLLHVLQNLDWYCDEDGNERKIDGSEGEVQICNITTLYGIIGPVQVGNTSYDVFLFSYIPFEWEGHHARTFEPQGMSPHFCVSHTDSDGVARMHSVYNPEYVGSYSPMSGIVGAYEYPEGILEANDEGVYNPDGAIFGSGAGLCTTDLSLPTGETRAMNLNEDPSQTVPFFNATAAAVEFMVGRMIAEGGRFDAHRSSLMGSGYSSNSPANSLAYWEVDATEARNGMRYKTPTGDWAFVSHNSSPNFGKGAIYPSNMLNSWRPAWRIMEQQRVLMYAVKHNIPELTWFGFEGNKYKWRHVDGFSGPSEGCMTAVVFKHFSSQMAAGSVVPGTETSIAGNRVEFLISSAVYRGIITDVSPSWWTSGLIFTEDENGRYEAYMQRDQSRLLLSPTSEIDATSQYPFETAYHHVGTFAHGEGYSKSVSSHALMLPAKASDLSGGGLFTYVGHYTWLSGSKPSVGRKIVLGFRRGYYAYNSTLSPLSVNGYSAPSIATSSIGFGTCVGLTETGAAEQAE